MSQQLRALDALPKNPSDSSQLPVPPAPGSQPPLVFAGICKHMPINTHKKALLIPQQTCDNQDGLNPSTWEAEAGRSVSSRPAWSKEQVPGQPGLHSETLSQKKKKKIFSFRVGQKALKSVWLHSKLSSCKI